MTDALVVVALAEAVALVYVVRLFLRDGKSRAELHARERAKLLDRIQAPQTATHASVMEDLPPSPPSVGFDSDEEFWEAKEAMNGRSGSS